MTMKKYLLPFLAIVVLASCSSPKYAYHFDQYDYNGGKKQKTSQADANVVVEVSPLELNHQELVASISEEVFISEAVTAPVLVTSDATATMESLSKAEKKVIRKEAVRSIKDYVKAVRSGEKEEAKKMAKAMDSDLRWAAIFGAIGITGMLIGGDVFYIIGGIALIVGVVFLVKWLVRQ